ncbi:MAG: DUF4270 domain-containing protein [Bacteroidetes bacterium]|nr:DUF4270 domain-containing protein [Bacteroidota bacterium]
MRIEKTHLVNFLNFLPTKQLSYPSQFGLVRMFFLYTCLFTLLSCKDESLTDADIQPDADKLNLSYLTSSDIKSYIMLEDPGSSDETDYNILGSYQDPIFGKTEASFATQFYMQGPNPIFKTGAINPKIDSIVLSLVYYSAYGDVSKSNGLQKVNVYELTKDLSLSKDYFTNTNTDTLYNAAQPIGTKIFQPKLSTSVKVGSVLEAPQLRIKLDTAVFGRKLMALDGTNAQNLVTQELFIKYFKGLYVKSDNSFQGNNQGAILFFDLLNSSSKITAYYHTDEAKSFNYVISSASNNFVESARINFVTHNYTTAPLIQNQLSNPTLGQQQIFVQDLAGIKCKIEVPIIQQLLDSAPIGINRAELIIKIDEPFIDKYVPNNSLYLFAMNDTGKAVFIPDYDAGNAYYGQAYDATNKQYKFNLSRYMQLVASGKISDHGFYLKTIGLNNANRSVLKGGNNIQFNLTYTKIKL